MNYHNHKHRDEVWVVISGEGKTIIDGEEQPVKVGDVVKMPAGCCPYGYCRDGIKID